jgi:cyanate permease
VTIGGSIALIIIGAILRFGITWEPRYINLPVIGLIIMIGGIVGAAISVGTLVTRRRREQAAQAADERRYSQTTQ